MPMVEAPGVRVIAIGASAGGVPLLRRLVTALPGDLTSKVGLATGAQPRVQLIEALNCGHRDKVAAAEATDLALDAALFMRALQADAGELRLKQIVRAQRDEAI